MCGIFGFLHKYALDDTLIDRGIAANNTLIHRGPDGDGAWFDKAAGIFLSHRRLSIIDVDQRSNQPMQRDQLIISFNGEIYNYIEIKKKLVSCGHSFQTESDTEVILAAYQEWGEQCLKRFDGMFAFALWDASKQSLWLVRDPFGEKPLYWARLDDGVYFASEIKALKAMKPLFPDESEERHIEYFYNGFYQPPYTFYQNVFNLPPGHSVWISNQTAPTLSVYYNPQEVAQTVEPYTDINEAIDDTHTILRESVKKRLRSDVPVCVFLSGGIDSSLLAALVQEVKPSLKCFTISFPGEKEDESEHAVRVAKHLGVQHEVIPYRITDVDQLIHNALTIFDQPNSNWGVMPQLILHSKVKEFVKVALSGQGGDELFFGYGKYRVIHNYSKWYSLPFVFRSAIANLSILIAGKKRASSFASLFGIQKLENVHWMFRNFKTPKTLYSNFKSQVENKPFRQLLDSGLSLAQASRMFDILNTQPELQNASTDRSSMMYSLEVRTPFLHTGLFRCAERLPMVRHMQKNQNKYILRKVLDRYCPSRFFDRPKQGFTPPMAQWIREGLLDQYLLCTKNPWIPESVLKQMITEHQEGIVDHSTILFRTASFLKHINNY